MIYSLGSGTNDWMVVMNVRRLQSPNIEQIIRRITPKKPGQAHGENDGFADRGIHSRLV